MQPFWHFPATAGGQVNSINNAGIETFRGNELDSLTREICQNSLDAVKDESQPVVVEFKRFDLPATQFPNHAELLDVYKKCEATWRGRNPKSEQFIEQAQQLLTKSSIHFLRISDFNTKGLEGADSTELGTPWSSLIREAGSSNKGDSSGGSFGIGKSAPFANSKIRTLFYESLDSSGFKSHIGVANIMSFKKDDNETTVGTGYYTKDEHSTAIPGFLSLDANFNRTQTGTDIYIAAFEQKENWQQAIRHSVLFNFFITIHQQKLVVHIEDEVISHENLGTLIESLDDSKEEFRHLKSYYEVLISHKAIAVPSPKRQYKTIGTFEEGEATLYIMKDDDLNRRVLMTRKAGMRLFEQNRISGSISFTGILIITGKHMNQVFKEMENPAHTEWQPNRYEADSKQADKALKDLRRFVRDMVLEHFQAETTDTMDAIGLSDFLPDAHIAGEGDEKRESLTMKIKEVKQKKKEKPKKKTKKQSKGEDFEKVLIDAGIEDGIGGGDGPKPPLDGEEGAKLPPDDKQHEDGGNGDDPGSKEKKEKNKPIDTDMRYLCMDKSQGYYRVNIKPDKKFEKGKLEFKVSGEQSEFDLPIVSVQSDEIEVTSIQGNVVRFKNKVGKKEISLKVQVDYDHYCVLEVNLYEI